MKILIICQYYYPENFIITNIAEELVKRGHNVDVLTGKPNYGYGHILEEYKNISEQVINGVNIFRVKLSPRKESRLSVISNYLSFWKNSKKWVKKCQTIYDAVYTMSLSPVTMCSAGNLYKKIHYVPHIIHCVDLWPESVLTTKAVKKNSILYKILLKWSKSIYSKANKILIGSPSFASYFDEVLNINKDKLFFVPQCSLIENTDTLPYKYGEGIHILYCGNLGLVQQIPLIVETMKIIEEKDIYFHIIGMGPMTNYLLDETKKCGLENNIIYHGPMSAKNASAYFKNADAIYVSLEGMDYIGKTIPNKLMMSMAFGKLIIGVLEGDGKEVLKAAGGSLLSEPNPESLKETIKALKNMDENTKQKYGMLNKLYYENNFSCSEIVKKIEANLQK